MPPSSWRCIAADGRSGFTPIPRPYPIQDDSDPIVLIHTGKFKGRGICSHGLCGSSGVMSPANLRFP